MFSLSVTMSTRLVRIATAVALVGAALLSPAHFHAATASGSGDGIGTPLFTTDGGDGFRTSNTIPYWASSYTDPTNGQSYSYTMVGTSPFNGSASTTVPTELIPLRFSFASAPTGVDPVLDGSTKVALTVQSPIFQSADIGAAADSTASPPPAAAGIAPSPRTETEPSDVTQLTDAFMRSEFGKSGSAYHVLLGQPTVLPTQSIEVPSNQGVLQIGGQSGARTGIIDYVWFNNRLHNLLGSLHIDPHTFPIFLTYNTFLYLGNNTANCCVVGYHGAVSVNGNGAQGVQTYAFAAYNDPGIFAPVIFSAYPYIQDIHALSHEVAEWSNDPFVNNTVNPWLSPTAPAHYGCTSKLETGDPVVGYGFGVSMPNGVTYHPEDEVFYSWFARQSPSISSAGPGVYTYLNNFAGIAHGC